MRTRRRFATRIILVIAALCGTAVGQLVQPQWCVAFNDFPIGNATPVNLCNTIVSVSFVAATTFTATEIEVFGSAPTALCGSVGSPQAGQVNGCVTTPTPPAPAQHKWWTIPVSPITIGAGQPCTVTIFPYFPPVPPGGVGGMVLYSNSAGTSPLLMTRTCPNLSPCPFGTLPCQQPPMTTNLVFRLRGPACTGGVPSVVMAVGTGCGTPPPVLASGLPTLGDAGFSLTLSTGTSSALPAFLFFAEGVATSGTSIEPGSPCLTYLNPISFAALAALGREPLQTANVPLGGVANLPLPIAATPQLIGLVVTFQAALVDTNGIPLGTVPGVALRLSNALTLQIGG